MYSQEFSWCILPDFDGHFELMLNTECVKQMESDYTMVDDKSTLERLKTVTLIEKNSLHYLNVSNTWKFSSIHKKILGICYNCDADDKIKQKLPVPRNEENIN